MVRAPGAPVAGNLPNVRLRGIRFIIQAAGSIPA
jgi:hypothetical protein